MSFNHILQSTSEASLFLWRDGDRIIFFNSKEPSFQDPRYFVGMASKTKIYIHRNMGRGKAKERDRESNPRFCQSNLGFPYFIKFVEDAERCAGCKLQRSIECTNIHNICQFPERARLEFQSIMEKQSEIRWVNMWLLVAGIHRTWYQLIVTLKLVPFI